MVLMEGQSLTLINRIKETKSLMHMNGRAVNAKSRAGLYHHGPQSLKAMESKK
jgi:hypothetical protein